MAKSKRGDLHVISNDVDARHNGPQHRKTFHERDLVVITPKTFNQGEAMRAWYEGSELVLAGTAGTGKTFIAMFLGLQYVLRNDAQRVVIVRSAQPSRDVGHLPGELEEKLAPYESPYHAICDQLFPFKKSYENMKRNGLIEFEPTSFLRGTTIDNAVIIVDEFQNMTENELDTIMTRVGTGSRVIVCGDGLFQCDIPKNRERADLVKFLKVIDRMHSFERINFTVKDIVRSGFVRDYIMAREAVDPK